MKRKLKLFRPALFTKNHTAEPLKRKNKALPLYPKRVVIGLGSTTETPSHYDIRINPPEAVRNSSNKLTMKQLFLKAGVFQAIWYTIRNSRLYFENIPVDINEIQYPLIAKQVYGKKGEGMKLLHNPDELNSFLTGNTSGYYVEKFYNYGKEYRIHTSVVTPCFYACRKVRRNDADNKWFFNSTNCNWLVEENPNFDKPNNWNQMVEHAQKALLAVGLHTGAVDIRVQGNDKSNPDFIVCEINSAPAFGDRTTEEYKKELDKVIKYYL